MWLQDRSPHLDRQFCEQQTSGLERQGWGHILCPQYHHQARLEVDYGGPVLSLGNCETVNSLNYPEKETDQLQERNLSVHSQAGQDLRSQIQSPYTQIWNSSSIRMESLQFKSSILIRVE